MAEKKKPLPLNLQIQKLIKSSKDFVKNGKSLSICKIYSVSIDMDALEDGDFIYNGVHYQHKYSGKTELSIIKEGKIQPSNHYYIVGYFDIKDDKAILNTPIEVGREVYSNI